MKDLPHDRSAHPVLLRGGLFPERDVLTLKAQPNNIVGYDPAPVLARRARAQRHMRLADAQLAWVDRQSPVRPLQNQAVFDQFRDGAAARV